MRPRDLTSGPNKRSPNFWSAWMTPPLDKQFEDLSLSSEIDLEVGTFLIAKFGYPEVLSDPYVDLLDEMAADLSPHVSKNDHPIHTIRELNAYLFDEKGFKGGAVRDPENSFINRVLDRRVGIPITLSAVYLFFEPSSRSPGIRNRDARTFHRKIS